VTTRSGSKRSLIEWAWRNDELHELRRHHSATDQRTLAEARSCLTVAWRALAGVEDIPDDTRLAVALPLLAHGAQLCAALVAPGGGGVASLVDEPAWQERFRLSGLAPEKQLAAQAVLRGEPPDAEPNAAAEAAVIALRTVLEAADVRAHAIAGVLWRRVWVVLSAVVLLAASTAGVLTWIGSGRAVDLAEGKPWVASSAYSGFSLQGKKPARPILGLFFSTVDEDKPWWRLDLERAYRISHVEVVNRTDCCPERAHPLTLELSTDARKWREVARRTEAFKTWKASFPATQARFLRLRSLRKTLLHFKDVRVYSDAP
jgi:hypothetical protein